MNLEQPLPAARDRAENHIMNASVIIRTYNRGYIIAEAIESALKQTYPSFEIVVVDDGSTDNTAEVVQAICSEKIRYIRHEHNRGVSAAANTGVEAASGDVVAFLDSDDLWKPELLERLVGFLGRHPEAGAVFADIEILKHAELIPSTIALMTAFPKLLARRTPDVPGEYSLSSRDMYLCLLEEVPIKPTVVVVRREAIAKAGLFNLSWPSGEDWEFFIRVARHFGFGYVDAPLAVQRIRPDSTFLRFGVEDKVSLIELFVAEKVKLRNDPEALQAITRGISRHCSHLGWLYLRADQRRRSVAVYLQGFRETGEVAMLARAASAFVPRELRSTLIRALKRRKQPLA